MLAAMCLRMKFKHADSVGARRDFAESNKHRCLLRRFPKEHLSLLPFFLVSTSGRAPHSRTQTGVIGVTTSLITGATSGIGRAIALTLSDAGYQVYAIGRNEQALESLRRERPTITPILLDITDRDATEAVLSGVQVDVLINNAGVMPPLTNFADMKMSDIDQALEINLSAAIILTRLIVPQMRERQSGHIIFTGSAAAHTPYPNMAVYSAAKAGIAGFCASLRSDLSAFGVRVTEIVPGRVETGLYKSILNDEARAAMYAGDLAVQPEDIASIVLAALSLPPRADVTRFDIMPTRPTPPTVKK